jgi:hypothetical protein
MPPLQNGTLLTLGIVGVVAAVGAANKAGLYGSRSKVEVPPDAVFYATTKGGKYQIVITPAGVYDGVQAYDLREYTRGNVSGMGTNNMEGLRDRFPRMLHDSTRIDGVHFLVKKDTLGLMGEARGSRATSSTRLRPLEHRSVKATAAESAGMVNPPVVIEVFVPNPNAKGRGKSTKAFRLVTAAGTSDDIDVFRYGVNLLVVIKNSHFPYVGATLFTRDAPEPWRVDQDVFFQGSEEAEEALGKRWESWSAKTLASHLLDVMS